jgi:hypothetical protein
VGSNAELEHGVDAAAPTTGAKHAKTGSSAELEHGVDAVAPTAGAKQAKAASNAELVREAEAAAGRGDCARARALIGRIEASYRARALKNAAIAKCMDE